ncbi:MAG TPA: DUF433 domain-containing protein [Solirubrobacterales bacterium]|nr:DUF433 domain-containing protein [Solirubrobacterales bacterium]
MTRNEIAEISGVSINAVNKALEQRVAKARRQRGRTLLAADEAAALVLLSELPISLSIKFKREVRNWIVKRNPAKAEEFELSRALRVAMTENAADVAKRAIDYVRLREKYVEVDPAKKGGAPVIRGTRVPVRTLAQLVEGGESPKALKEDYPHIPEEAYDVAVLWAKGNPRRGRPPGQRRTRSAGRAATA